MNSFSEAVFDIEQKNGAFVATRGGAFSATEYSRFKYGDRPMARKFALKLFEYFKSKYGSWLAEADKRPFVVVSIKFTAAGTLSEHFVRLINDELAQKGKTLRLELQFLKPGSFSGDYSTMSEAARREAIASTKLLFDAAMVSGRRVVLIDDIYITGATQELNRGLLEHYGVSEALFLSIAQLDKSQAISEPGLEAKLNMTWMDSIERLQQVIENGDFVLNVRVLKFILSYPDAVALERFVGAIPIRLLSEMITAAKEGSYNGMDKYRSMFGVLEKVYQERVG